LRGWNALTGRGTPGLD